MRRSSDSRKPVDLALLLRDVARILGFGFHSRQNAVDRLFAQNRSSDGSG